MQIMEEFLDCQIFIADTQPNFKPIDKTDIDEELDNE